MKAVAKENYLRYLAELHDESLNDVVSVGQLARAVGVTPGTCTTMVKSLHQAKLLQHKPYEGVTLTEAGRIEALKVLRRHRILELFLVRILGIDWSSVHEEADRLEHAVSDRVIASMDRMLGHPDEDPHGDPIPGSDGSYDGKYQLSRKPESLKDSEAGREYTLIRVTDEGPEFLQYLNSLCLMPGVSFILVDRDERAGTVSLRLADRKTATFGLFVAEKLLVEATHDQPENR